MATQDNPAPVPGKWGNQGVGGWASWGPPRQVGLPGETPSPPPPPNQVGEPEGKKAPPRSAELLLDGKMMRQQLYGLLIGG